MQLLPLPMACMHAITAGMASDKVAEFAASGFVFKDKVDVVSLPDEKVSAAETLSFLCIAYSVPLVLSEF